MKQAILTIDCVTVTCPYCGEPYCNGWTGSYDWELEKLNEFSQSNDDRLKIWECGECEKKFSVKPPKEIKLIMK